MAHFDKRETRKAATREKQNFAELRDILASARSKAPQLKQQLKGIKIEALKDRAALAKVPVFRKSDLLALQRKTPPFAGWRRFLPVR